MVPGLCVKPFPAMARLRHGPILSQDADLEADLPASRSYNQRGPFSICIRQV